MIVYVESNFVLEIAPRIRSFSLPCGRALRRRASSISCTVAPLLVHPPRCMIQWVWILLDPR